MLFREVQKHFFLSPFIFRPKATEGSPAPKVGGVPYIFAKKKCRDVFFLLSWDFSVGKPRGYGRFNSAFCLYSWILKKGKSDHTSRYISMISSRIRSKSILRSFSSPVFRSNTQPCTASSFDLIPRCTSAVLITFTHCS